MLVLYGMRSRLTCAARLTNIGPFSVLSEPKSGTGAFGDMGRRVLDFTCTYLQNLYGERSCRTDVDNERKLHTLVFEPELDNNAPCTCDDVSR